MKQVKITPLNAYEDYYYQSVNPSIRIETARTLKAQYWKNSLANFIRQDGLGATAVMVIYDNEQD